MQFKQIDLPSGKTSIIPEKLDVKFPKDSDLSADKLNYLSFIPWNDDYLSLVPEDFVNFFKFTLPYISVRTTDVHTAYSMSFLDEFLHYYKGEANRLVVGYALILHDVGWGKLTDKEIANSLMPKGFALDKIALAPKEKHAIQGRVLAEEILETYKFDTELTSDEKEIILDCVLYHDKPEQVTKNGKLPLEVKLVVDLDHVWSLTEANFWQNTVRKAVSPSIQLKMVNEELEPYYVTEKGKEKARELLREREIEVNEFFKYVEDEGLSIKEDGTLLES